MFGINGTFPPLSLKLNNPTNSNQKPQEQSCGFPCLFLGDNKVTIKNNRYSDKGCSTVSNHNFNMSFDPTTRQAFADVLADYGLTVPQAFKLFANQVIKTGVVPLSFDWRTPQYEANPTTIRAINDLENGIYTESTLDELLEQKNA